MAISVTQDDIINGERQSTSWCAVSRALKKMGFQRPIVDNSRRTVTITDPESRQRVTYKMPLEMAEWISQWDRGEPVSTQEFRLTQVVSYREMGAPVKLTRPKPVVRKVTTPAVRRDFRKLT